MSSHLARRNLNSAAAWHASPRGTATAGSSIFFGRDGERRSIGRLGAGACTICEHPAQLSFGRTVRITLTALKGIIARHQWRQ
jgi:hypothetical protein